MVGAEGAAPWLLKYIIYVMLKTTEDAECTKHFCISLCSSVHSVVNIEMIPAPIRSFTLPPPAIYTRLCPVLCMRAAIEARKEVDAAVISKVHPLRSHSGAAQGGIAAVLYGRYWKVDESALKLLFKTSSY